MRFLHLTDRVELELPHYAKLVVILAIALTPVFDETGENCLLPFRWPVRFVLFLAVILAAFWNTVLGILVALWIMSLFIACSGRRIRRCPISADRYEDANGKRRLRRQLKNKNNMTDSRVHTEDS